MRPFILAACLLVLVGSVSSVKAQDRQSAIFYIPHCQQSVSDVDLQHSFRAGFCMGQVIGIAHGDSRICRPVGSNNEQSVRVVLTYITARPARMHERFMFLATEALRAAWPCP